MLLLSALDRKEFCYVYSNHVRSARPLLRQKVRPERVLSRASDNHAPTLSVQLQTDGREREPLRDDRDSDRRTRLPALLRSDE